MVMLCGDAKKIDSEIRCRDGFFCEPGDGEWGNPSSTGEGNSITEKYFYYGSELPYIPY